MRVTHLNLWVSTYDRGLNPELAWSSNDKPLLGSIVGVEVGRYPSLHGLTSSSPTVFIYSMPGYKCSIKERMLYSSCKSRLLDSVEQDFQLEIAKKVQPAPRVPSPHPSRGTLESHVHARLISPIHVLAALLSPFPSSGRERGWGKVTRARRVADPTL